VFIVVYDGFPTCVEKLDESQFDISQILVDVEYLRYYRAFRSAMKMSE